MENKNVVCPRCAKPYAGYPAVSRADHVTPICPECGLREALLAAGMGETDQEKILMKIRAIRA